MNAKVLGLIMLAVMFKTACASAQTAPLVSDPNVQQPPVVSKKARSVFLDIPIIPLRKTIDIQRVRDGAIDLGPALDPWGKNVLYRINIAPELTMSETDRRLEVASGFAEAYDQGRPRTDGFLDVAVDHPIWKFTAGAASFVEEEKVKGVYEIVDITHDFSRLSYGVKLWSGLKVGSFSGSFLSVNAGGGYVETQGKMKYRHPVLDIQPARLYKDDFYTHNLKAEGRKVYPRVSVDAKFEGVSYVGGETSFLDLDFQGTLEIVPFKKPNSVRVLARGNSHLKKYDSLLFRTTEPEFQVYLRIKIR